MTPQALADQPAEVALPLLLEEHGGRLFGLGLKLCGHAEDAEDLVQDVFLIAFRKWHQFKGDSLATTWLYSIAARACLRRRRKRAGEPRTIESLSELLPGVDDPIPDIAPIRVPPEDLCLRCQALFATLDLGRETCAILGRGEMPAALREVLSRSFQEPTPA